MKWLCRKNVDKSVLWDGMSLKTDDTKKVFDLLGKPLQRGEDQQINIIVDNKIYEAKFYSSGAKQRVSDQIQIRYSGGSPISRQLRSVFSLAASKLIDADGGAIKGAKVNDYFNIFGINPTTYMFNCHFRLTEEEYNLCKANFNYLAAAKTKPFIILGGFSGTGKSQKVKELAYLTCPNIDDLQKGQDPGNYCLISVKPNWHDSTDLLGYYSNIGKKYVVTDFIKFLVKAMRYPLVPFFVCMDEMNLAPVEEYFAEYLSVLESRKVKDGQVVSASLISKDVFKDEAVFEDLGLTVEDSSIKEDLKANGLRLPQNIVVIGTVNMDDTTHQFSRKVIDRAMTIEMNGGNLRNMFGGSRNLEYLPNEEQQKWQNTFARRYVTADEVLEAHSDVAKELVEKLPAHLEEINKTLKGTPFEVSYRVLNELTIMVGVMLDEERELDCAITQSVNNILLMKILPRIEGDAEMFALSREYKNKVGVSYDNRLEWLKELAPDIKEKSIDTTSENGDAEETSDKDKEHQQTAKEKIQEMIDRLNNQEFTRFWP